ncbi:MAG: nucleoside deaminase [Phycisphaerales bacterium]|nr:nucleoside deaminase [Phycisphaerales bacterium]
MATTHVTVRLPDWLCELIPELSALAYPTDDERMEVALRVAMENIRHGTGGPFGAAVFNLKDGSLVSVGVNLVTSSGLSMTHAEVVAIAMAQAEVRRFDLGDAAAPPLQLATSAEPCSMCIGAIHWSGLRSIIAAARDEDVRAIGFDEGNKPANWVERFAETGVAYRADVLRRGGIDVLQAYAEQGGRIYNAGM